jgi:hypothetical protein
MKITTVEKIEKEIEVSFPCYRKDKTWIVKLISENEYINLMQETGSYFAYHNSAIFGVSEFFTGKYEPATQQEFSEALLKTNEGLQEQAEKHFKAISTPEIIFEFSKETVNQDL